MQYRIGGGCRQLCLVSRDSCCVLFVCRCVRLSGAGPCRNHASMRAAGCCALLMPTSLLWALWTPAGLTTGGCCTSTHPQRSCWVGGTLSGQLALFCGKLALFCGQGQFHAAVSACNMCLLHALQTGRFPAKAGAPEQQLPVVCQTRLLQHCIDNRTMPKRHVASTTCVCLYAMCCTLQVWTGVSPMMTWPS